MTFKHNQWYTIKFQRHCEFSIFFGSLVPHVGCVLATYNTVTRDCFQKINPLTPMPAVTGRESVGLCSTSDVITFDQNWHLHSTSAGGQDLFNATQIRVIDSMEPEICTKCSEI